MSVGIHRVRLAQETTQAVNDRIAANRERKAKEIEVPLARPRRRRSGPRPSRAASGSWRSRTRWAKEIEAEGNIAAAKFQAQMNEYPDLAVFLKNLDLIKAAFMLGRR